MFELLCGLSSTGRVLTTHTLSECLMRNPLGGGPRSGFRHHLVDLLERKTLGLRNHEESEEERQSTSSSPHEENLGAEVSLIPVDHVRSDVAIPKVSAD